MKRRDKRFKKRIVIVFAFLLGVMIANASLFYRNLYTILHNERETRNVNSIVTEIETLSASINTVARTHDGFLLTGQRSYFDLYYQTKDEVNKQFTSLENLFSTSQDSLEDLQKVKSLVTEYFQLGDKSLETYQLRGLRSAQQFFLANELKQKIDVVHEELEKVKSQQQSRLQNAFNRYEQSVDNALFTFTGASIANLILIIAGYSFFQRDYKQRRLLHETELRYRRLIEANIIGIMFTDLEGKIFDANDAFLKIIGYTPRDLEQEKIRWDLITPRKYRKNDERAIAELKQFGKAHPWEKEYIRKDGKRVPVLVGAALLDDFKNDAVAFVLDITDLKEAQDKLKESKEQLEVILQTVGDGITVQDATGQIIYVNNAAARMSGFTPTEMLAMDKTVLMGIITKRFTIYNEDGERILPENFPSQRALMGKSHSSANLRFVNNETNEEKWSLLRAEPIFDEEHKVQFAVNVITDVTESKELEKRKDEFISIASHELKTPLTTIKAYVQILEQHFKKIEDSTSLSYVHKMEAYMNKLTSLITDLLDVSKIQSGKLQLNKEVIVFDEFVKESIGDIQPTTKSHHIILEGKTDQKVMADPLRLEQALTNLLTNAIKYSPKAQQVTVHLSQQDNAVVLAVQDFGIGINPDKLKQIFDKFFRAEEVTAGFSGLGIGLYITQEIIERHGGKIWAESEKGKGSTFYISLPIHKR